MGRRRCGDDLFNGCGEIGRAACPIQDTVFGAWGECLRGGIGCDVGQAHAEGLGECEAECLAVAGVDEEVGAKQVIADLRPIEGAVQLDAICQVRPLDGLFQLRRKRPIADEVPDDIAARGESLGGIDQVVNSLLGGKPADKKGVERTLLGAHLLGGRNRRCRELIRDGIADDANLSRRAGGDHLRLEHFADSNDVNGAANRLEDERLGGGRR